MTFPLRFAATAVLAALLAAGPVHAVQPAALATQIERLTGLLGDSHVSPRPAANQVQRLGGLHGQKLVLALLTIEAYGGGNNHRQYLAVFEEEVDESGPRGHVMLLGVVQIGAKGWRAVPALQAELRIDERNNRTTLLIPALINTAGDAANFPSRKATIQLVLDRNLREVEAGDTP